MRNIHHIPNKENTYQLKISLKVFRGLKIITNRPNLMQQISIVPMEVQM